MPLTSDNSQVNRFNSLDNWYAIYTRHQHEKTVARILASKGFETFLPLYSTAHRWKDRTKLVSLPLLPCYVFLKGDLDRHLDIVTTPGTHAIVSTGGQPAAIPDAEIEGIRRAIESGASIEPHPPLKSGDRVRVKSGALEGIEGILIRSKSQFRVVLSVEMLHQSAAVEVELSTVERTASGRAPGRSIA